MGGGTGGAAAATAGTSGGADGMNEAQRRLAWLYAGGFALTLAVVLVANVESRASDLAAAGTPIAAAHVWLEEGTSLLAWLALLPVIWRLVAAVLPPRRAWPAAAAAVALASVPLSLAHVGLMVGARTLGYRLLGEAYRFGPLPAGLLYEYRKDAATLLQLVAFAALVAWQLARLGDPSDVAPAPASDRATLAVSEGAVTHHVPVAAIERVEAAGNYVELALTGRTLLHRATLAAVAEALGPGFVRIHRSRLVARGAIRRVEVERSGDFVVTLASGEVARGSRRYRAGLDGGDAV